jgi:uncharacterized protein (TIGR03437 family)
MFLMRLGWLCALGLASRPIAAQLLRGVPPPSAVAVDSEGYIYLVGQTNVGLDLSPTPGVVQPSLPPGRCLDTPAGICTHGFVAKVAPSGDRVVWATYLTGVGPDSVTAVVVAADGSAYVAGVTTPGNVLPAGAGQASAIRQFVARLSSDGRTVLGAAYLAGSGTDIPVALKLDAAGNVYLAGTTTSADFPTTAAAYQRTFEGAPGGDPTLPIICKGSDQFVAKFDPALRNVRFSTFIGTSWTERTDAFAIGPDGTLHIAGTRGTERGLCPAWPILTRLNSEGSAALYTAVVRDAPSPYGGYAVAVDATGGAILAGDTRRWALSPPAARIWRLDPQGRIVATRDMSGLVLSLASGSGEELVLLGSSWPGRLTPTPGAPGGCYQSPGSPMSDQPYVARLNTRTLVPAYLGYLWAPFAWLADVGRVVVVGNRYDLRPSYAVLPVGPPGPGTVTCAANSANYISNAVSPGELVSVFGVGIGPPSPAAARLDAAGNVTSELAGVRVWAGGLPAPLLYVSSNQINLVMPSGVSGETVRMELYRDGTRVAAFDKPLLPLHPGLFSTGVPFTGPLAALNQDGSVNSPSNPAAPGSIISVFGTGLGAMTPPLPDGFVAQQPVNVPAALPEAVVNNQPGEILYIGNAPGVVQGVVQVNLRLPNPIAPVFGAAPGTAYITLRYPSYGVPGGVVSVR